MRRSQTTYSLATLPLKLEVEMNLLLYYFDFGTHSDLFARAIDTILCAHVSHKLTSNVRPPGFRRVYTSNNRAN